MIITNHTAAIHYLPSSVWVRCSLKALSLGFIANNGYAVDVVRRCPGNILPKHIFKWVCLLVTHVVCLVTTGPQLRKYHLPAQAPANGVSPEDALSIGAPLPTVFSTGHVA